MTDVNKRIALGDVLRAETKAARLSTAYENQEKREGLISRKGIKKLLDDYDLTDYITDKNFRLAFPTGNVVMSLHDVLTSCLFNSSLCGKLTKEQEIIVELRLWRVLQDVFLENHKIRNIKDLAIHFWFIKVCDETEKSYEATVSYFTK